jgi:hypothetical protein
MEAGLNGGISDAPYLLPAHGAAGRAIAGQPISVFERDDAAAPDTATAKSR